MDLFRGPVEEPHNLLSKEGDARYYGALIPLAQASQHFSILRTKIQWKHDQAVIGGERITTKRMVAWYGDKPFLYTYSNTTKRALPWTEELLTLKEIAQTRTGERFNSCLLNLYQSGDEGMAWHSDAERDLKKNGAIASLSFGAERKFSFKHKESKESVSLTLEHGSLMVMKGCTQTYWQHRLPPTKTIKTPRINLTFRSMRDA